MNTIGFWGGVLTASGVYGAVSIIAMLIARSWIKKHIDSRYDEKLKNIQLDLDKKRDQYQNDLKIKQEVELASLRQNSVEHQVTFNKLQSKRFENIEELYLTLNEIMTAFKWLDEINDSQDPEQEILTISSKIEAQLKKLWEILPLTTLYLSNSMENMLDKLKPLLYDVSTKLQDDAGLDVEARYQFGRARYLNDEEYEATTAYANSLLNELKKEIKIITGAETD